MGPLSDTQSKTRGFSLIELMVVLGVAGIMLAFAIPSFNRWKPGNDVKMAARDLFSTMKKARLTAIKESSSAAVLFNPGANTYQLLRDPGPDGIWGTGDDQNAHPGDDDNYGTVDDVAEAPAITLPVGITFSSLAAYDADLQLPRNPIPANGCTYINNIVVFNSVGYLFDANSIGHVYIANTDTSFAVGTPDMSGGIALLRWFPASVGTEGWGR